MLRFGLFSIRKPQC